VTNIDRKRNNISNFQKTELDSKIPRYLWAIPRLEEDAAPQPNTFRELK